MRVIQIHRHALPAGGALCLHLTLQRVVPAGWAHSHETSPRRPSGSRLTGLRCRVGRRPDAYPDHLFLKALVVMLVRWGGGWTSRGLLAVLAEPTGQMAQVRVHLADPQGRFPSRRTWERRLDRLGASPAALLNIPLCAR
jgi:hypothetical protein